MLYYKCKNSYVPTVGPVTDLSPTIFTVHLGRSNTYIGSVKLGSQLDNKQQ